jgi:hypothetical protein
MGGHVAQFGKICTQSLDGKPEIKREHRMYLCLLCFVLLVPCFLIVSFMYIYSYLFCLYYVRATATE